MVPMLKLDQTRMRQVNTLAAQIQEILKDVDLRNYRSDPEIKDGVVEARQAIARIRWISKDLATDKEKQDA